MSRQNRRIRRAATSECGLPLIQEADSLARALRPSGAFRSEPPDRDSTRAFRACVAGRFRKPKRSGERDLRSHVVQWPHLDCCIYLQSKRNAKDRPLFMRDG
jgi:hypothetical protein